MAFESKKSKANQNQNQNSHTYDNGHLCKNYQDAHFEPLWLFFSKLNFPISLLIIQEHIKVITLALTNLATLFSIAYNKHPK
jgi:hypothetical protein